MAPALIPPEAVEGLMKKAFVDHQVEPGLFWDALLKANLYIPISSKDAPVSTELDENSEEIPILLGTDAEGIEVLWLFTSPQTMKDYIEEALPYKEIAAPRIFSLLKESEYDIVLIGPAKLTLNLHKDLITSLGDNKVPDQPSADLQAIPQDMSVFVGSPEEDTTPLETRLKQVFEGLTQVTEASFIQVADEANGKRLLLGLKLKDESKEEFQKVAQRIAQAVQGVLPNGKTMDVTLMSRTMKGAFEKWGKSFFKR